MASSFTFESENYCNTRIAPKQVKKESRTIDETTWHVQGWTFSLQIRDEQIRHNQIDHITNHIPKFPNNVSCREVFTNEEMGWLTRDHIGYYMKEEKRMTYSEFIKIEDAAIIAYFNMTSKVCRCFPDNLSEMRIHGVIGVVLG